MYRQTEEMKQKIAADSRTFNAKLIAGGKEAAGGFRSIQVKRQSNNGDYVSIGGTAAAVLQVTMENPGIALENQEIELQIGVKSGESFLYETIGKFTVQRPEDDDGILTFNAYDRMVSKLSKPYFSELPYPADGKEVLQEISVKTGVPLADIGGLPDGVMIPLRQSVGESTYDEDGNEIQNVTYVAPFNGYTYREALGYLAQFYGKFATINRMGEIELRWYEEVDYTVSASRYYDDLVKNELVWQLGALECTVGDSVLTAGEGTTGMQIENPVMTQARLDAVYTDLKDFQFLPVSFSFLGDTCLDLGDIITVNDKYGNAVKVPVMSLTLDFDGGLITEVKSFGRTEAESEAGVKGPVAQAIDRIYAELFLAKEIIGNKANFDDLKAVNAEFRSVKADYGNFRELTATKLAAVDAEFDSLSTRYARVDLANISNGCITTAMIGTGAVGSAQIADGSITDAKIVELTANKITAGTLSVERLVISGSDKSVIYAINNAGELESQETNTINGDVLTERSVTADKIVANAITANEIASKTITANQIAANSITAGEIAAGAVTADKIAANSITASKIAIGTGGNLYNLGYDTFDNVSDIPYYSKSSYATVSVVSEAGYSYYGKKSLKYVAGNSTSSYVYLGTAGTNYGCIPVQAGKYYCISCYAKSTATNVSCRLTAVGHTAVNTTNSSTANYVTGTVGTSWTRLQKTFLASASYPYQSVRLAVATSDATVYFDAIQIEEVASVSQQAGMFKPAATTYMDGSNIITGTIKSQNYSYTSGNYSNAGTIIDLNNGIIRTPGFCSADTGEAFFKGEIHATSGTLKDVYIVDKLNMSYSGGLIGGTTGGKYAAVMFITNEYQGITGAVGVNNTLAIGSSSLRNVAVLNKTCFYNSIEMLAETDTDEVKIESSFNPISIKNNGAEFFIRAANQIGSQQIYNNTGGAGSANVYIWSDGALGRTTSATKYKLNISPLQEESNYPYRILNLELKQWFDKTAVERYSALLAKEYAGEAVTDADKAAISTIESCYGLIAEEVEAAGLGKYCHYNEETGEIEGIMYDKLCTLLIPITKDIVLKVKELEIKIRELGRQQARRNQRWKCRC